MRGLDDGPDGLNESAFERQLRDRAERPVAPAVAAALLGLGVSPRAIGAIRRATPAPADAPLEHATTAQIAAVR